MDFDIVIATRNRPSALKLSLPLILRQDRLPRKLILVDASDDHSAVRRVVETMGAQAPRPVELRLLQSAAGSSAQRNRGIAQCASPVVLLPDDDSLWYPGYAEAIMRLYEQDSQNTVGAVCGTETTKVPGQAAPQVSTAYRKSFKDRLHFPGVSFLDRIERRLMPDPLITAGRDKWRMKTVPAWFSAAKAAVSGPMTGFRMSFRTALIREHPFDESLGRYALFEDYDASLAILDRWMIGRAKNALVYHHRFPEPRVNGVDWGVLQVLNRAFVVCKHTAPGAKARADLMRYSLYKVMRYFLQSISGQGWPRTVGAWRAAIRVPRLGAAPPEQLTDLYLKLRAECIRGDGSGPAKDGSGGFPP
jgi:glycosyltransferase involved in cell wall biosynthesis